MARNTAPKCITAEQAAQIKKRLDALWRLPKFELVAQVKRHRRVVDVRGALKGDLVALRLDDEFYGPDLEAFDAGRIC